MKYNVDKMSASQIINVHIIFRNIKFNFNFMMLICPQLQPEYSALIVSSLAVAEVTDVPYAVKSRHYSVDSFQVTYDKECRSLATCELVAF